MYVNAENLYLILYYIILFKKYRDLFLKISPRYYQVIIMNNPLMINEDLFLINFVMKIYF